MKETGKAKPLSAGAAATVTIEGGSVGEIFKNAREKQGLTLTSVSKELMIRKYYLTALEEGRYHELPSIVYATGFIKSYAELLGLEVGILIDQFKRERGVASNRTELFFPEAVTESKLPGTPVILGGLAAAAVVLFVWASVMGEDKANELQIIPEPAVMDTTKPATEAPIASSVEQSNTETITTETVSSETTPSNTSDTNGVATQSSLIIDNAANTGITVTGDTAITPDAQTNTPLSNTSQTTADNASVPTGNESVVESASTSGVADVAVTVETSVTTPAITPSFQPASTPKSSVKPALSQDGYRSSLSKEQEEVLNTGSSSKTINSGNGKSRVTVAVKEEAWIEIRDRNGVLLLSKVLQPGQRYDVPNEKGITMMTGNAGGVYLIVDGKNTSPIGQPSMVKRNIKLDADIYR